MTRDNSREIKIRLYYIISLVLFVAGLIACVVFVKNNRNDLMTYTDSSEVDYIIFLKENDYYEEKYLEKNQSYISSLIDKISANFEYNLNLNATYNYKYYIKAEVDVTDKTLGAKVLNRVYDIRESEQQKGSGTTKITENVEVEYQKYNELITSFKDEYKLKNVEANLNISLLIDIENIGGSNDKVQKRKVSSVSIPLAENTIMIEDTNNRSQNEYAVKLLKSNMLPFLLLIGVLLIIASVFVLAFAIFYYLKNRTAQMIYEKEIRSINSNYGSFIQKINESYDVGLSQVIKLESFNDVLEVRDTLKQPILMLENKDKTGTFFIIPASNNIIYTYAIRIIDIEAKMKGREVPTYEVSEISRKERKYTEEYIKKELEDTANMPVIDGSNLVGSSRQKDLYEQLELTRSFSVEEIKKAVKDAKRKKEYFANRTKDKKYVNPKKNTASMEVVNNPNEETVNEPKDEANVKESIPFIEEKREVKEESINVDSLNQDEIVPVKKKKRRRHRRKRNGEYTTITGSLTTTTLFDNTEIMEALNQDDKKEP